MTTCTPTLTAHAAQPLIPVEMGNSLPDADYWGRERVDARAGTRYTAKVEAKCEFTNGDTVTGTIVALPAGSLVRAVSIQYDDSFSLDTATKVGVGTSADPDVFYLSGTTFTDELSEHACLAVANAAAANLILSSVANDGSAAGDFHGGTIYFAVEYEYIADYDAV